MARSLSNRHGYYPEHLKGTGRTVQQQYDLAELPQVLGMSFLIIPILYCTDRPQVLKEKHKTLNPAVYYVFFTLPILRLAPTPHITSKSTESSHHLLYFSLGDPPSCPPFVTSEAPSALEAIIGSQAKPQQAAPKVTSRPTQIWRLCEAPCGKVWSLGQTASHLALDSMAQFTTKLYESLLTIK